MSEAPRAPDAAGRAARLAAPLLIGIAVLAAWEGAVRAWEVKHYVLPGPVLIAETLVRDWQTLLPSLLNTMKTALGAFLCAALGGLGIAILFARSRWLEASLFPYAVIVQVTPVVSIAPLIIIWVKDVEIALLICAWIVAFFPVVANTTLGLKSADHNLLNLFELYGASRRQVLWRLRLPGALPHYLSSLRIAGGLALIGAVVAEFVAGAGGAASGLAWRILESGYRLNIPRMFAALLLISLAGIAVFAALGWLQHAVLQALARKRGGPGELRGDYALAGASGSVRRTKPSIRPSIRAIRPSTCPIRPSTCAIRPSTCPICSSTPAIRPSTRPIRSRSPDISPTRIR